MVIENVRIESWQILGKPLEVGNYPVEIGIENLHQIVGIQPLIGMGRYGFVSKSSQYPTILYHLVI